MEELRVWGPVGSQSFLGTSYQANYEGTYGISVIIQTQGGFGCRFEFASRDSGVLAVYI